MFLHKATANLNQVFNNQRRSSIFLPGLSRKDRIGDDDQFRFPLFHEHPKVSLDPSDAFLLYDGEKLLGVQFLGIQKALEVSLFVVDENVGIVIHGRAGFSVGSGPIRLGSGLQFGLDFHQ